MKVDGLKNLLIRFAILSICIFLFNGCATVQVNSKLDQAGDFIEFLREGATSQTRSDELLVVLTFSGGGTRAAAMSYGVLEALSKVKIPNRHSTKYTTPNNHSLLG